MTTKKAAEPAATTVHAIKGFNPDLTCRGFQFAEGQTYEHDGPVSLCHSGFHAVTQPIDVLRYYPPTRSIYHEVDLEETVGPDGDDSKVAARVIKIGVKVELPALIKAQVDFVFAHAKKPTAGGVSKADHGCAVAKTENGAATASGDYGAATASGRSGAATASGDYGAATASGDYGAATASGDYGAATASGYYGAATASGDYGAATASGDYGAATASGRESVAVATGRNGRARGAIGCVLFLIERDANWHIVAHESVLVDGEQVKPDTYYTLRGGQVEVVA
jgi:hypothetical protein